MMLESANRNGQTIPDSESMVDNYFTEFAVQSLSIWKCPDITNSLFQFSLKTEFKQYFVKFANVSYTQFS